MLSSTLRQHRRGLSRRADADGEITASEIAEDVWYGGEHLAAVEKLDRALEISEVLHHVALIEASAIR